MSDEEIDFYVPPIRNIYLPPGELLDIDWDEEEPAKSKSDNRE